MDCREDWRGQPLEALLAAGLSRQVGVQVERVAALGRRRGDRAYLVGGLVRDLLLGVPHRDLDLMVEGDGLRFAEALAAETAGSVRKHEEFLTALVETPEGFEIDVVGARAERYASPATLPWVEPGDLASDLLRRDFTVNALALRISPEASPLLLDPAGGIADLEARWLRVLHPGSFRDDPTRLLRGVRLEIRLGFRLDPETEALAREAVESGTFDRLSGSRLRQELALLLGEAGSPEPGLERLAELGALAAFHPSLRWSAEVAEAVAEGEALLATPLASAVTQGGFGFRRWRFLWMVLALAAIEAAGKTGAALAAEVDALSGRLLLDGPDAAILLGFPERLASVRAALERKEHGDFVPHRVAEGLSALSGEELLLVAREEVYRPAVELYVGTLRAIRPHLRGADLLASGVRPGPAVGEALRAVRRARWDGNLEAEGELAFALAHLERLQGRQAGGLDGLGSGEREPSLVAAGAGRERA